MKTPKHSCVRVRDFRKLECETLPLLTSFQHSMSHSNRNETRDEKNRRTAEEYRFKPAAEHVRTGQAETSLPLKDTMVRLLNGMGELTCQEKIEIKRWHVHVIMVLVFHKSRAQTSLTCTAIIIKVRERFFVLFISNPQKYRS